MLNRPTEGDRDVLCSRMCAYGNARTVTDREACLALMSSIVKTHRQRERAHVTLPSPLHCSGPGRLRMSCREYRSCGMIGAQSSGSGLHAGALTLRSFLRSTRHKSAEHTQGARPHANVFMRTHPRHPSRTNRPSIRPRDQPPARPCTCSSPSTCQPRVCRRAPPRPNEDEVEQMPRR